MKRNREKMYMYMNGKDWFTHPRSRRSMLRQLSILVGAGLTAELGVTAALHARAAAMDTSNPVEHILIACQENRTFDTYFGVYPHVGSFGFPADYSLPDGKGGTVKPHHFPLPISL